ncbi:hypothetical protein [Acidovorax sp.]|uniref:hypothetical protein n=1 Tax=Acidovorax sp. TaxID=1872122 RepID=UPI00391AFD45
MPKSTVLSEAHILDSIAGEEDPGASLDVVRNLIVMEPPQRARPHPQPGPTPQIHMDCAEGTEVIQVDVGWNRRRARRHSAAELLGLVVAHHGAIANAAWSFFNTTGQRRVALEVDENAEGVLRVNLAGV